MFKIEICDFPKTSFFQPDFQKFCPQKSSKVQLKLHARINCGRRYLYQPVPYDVLEVGKILTAIIDRQNQSNPQNGPQNIHVRAGPEAARSPCPPYYFQRMGFPSLQVMC